MATGYVQGGTKKDGESSNQASRLNLILGPDQQRGENDCLTYHWYLSETQRDDMLTLIGECTAQCSSSDSKQLLVPVVMR